MGYSKNKIWFNLVSNISQDTTLDAIVLPTECSLCGHTLSGDIKCPRCGNDLILEGSYEKAEQ